MESLNYSVLDTNIQQSPWLIGVLDTDNIDDEFVAGYHNKNYLFFNTGIYACLRYEQQIPSFE